MRVATASYAATAAGVRAIIAAYAQAIDDGRHGDIAAMFCEDGSVNLPAAGVVAGREEEAPWGFRSAGRPRGRRARLRRGPRVGRLGADRDVGVLRQQGGGDLPERYRRTLDPYVALSVVAA